MASIRVQVPPKSIPNRTPFTRASGQDLPEHGAHLAGAPAESGQAGGPFADELGVVGIAQGGDDEPLGGSLNGVQKLAVARKEVGVPEEKDGPVRFRRLRSGPGGFLGLVLDGGDPYPGPEPEARRFSFEETGDAGFVLFHHDLFRQLGKVREYDEDFFALQLFPAGKGARPLQGDRPSRDPSGEGRAGRFRTEGALFETVPPLRLEGGDSLRAFLELAQGEDLVPGRGEEA